MFMSDRYFLFNHVLFITSINLFYLFCSSISEKSNKELQESDCYVTYSYPKLYLLLSHSYPNGPKYLYVQINFEIYNSSNSSTPEKLQTVHHFFRMKDKCVGSLVFTTKGLNFTAMNLRVIIHLIFNIDISDNSKLADISYTFNPDFHFGYYQLLDMNVNFGIWVHVLNFGLNYIETSSDNINNTLYYLRRLPWIELDICVVTENNINIVLRPNYARNPDGPIINIIAKFIKDGMLVDYIEFPAFGCNSHKENHHKSLYFIYEEFLKAELYLFVDYIKFNQIGWRFSEIPFEINNIKIIDVNKSIYIHPHYKKIFLMNYFEETEIDSFGYERILYISENGTIFYVKQLKNVQVSQGVKRKQWFSPTGLAASSA